MSFADYLCAINSLAAKRTTASLEPQLRLRLRWCALTSMSKRCRDIHCSVPCQATAATTITTSTIAHQGKQIQFDMQITNHSQFRVKHTNLKLTHTHTGTASRRYVLRHHDLRLLLLLLRALGHKARVAQTEYLIKCRLRENSRRRLGRSHKVWEARNI